MSLIPLINAISKPSGGGATASDSDAQAFLTAAGISDATIVAAIDNLVIDLKAAGVWTKCLAIYPFVGGTSGTHKWNLKNPVNSDGAYRLTFGGSWTHGATGATADGSSAYADTHLAGSDLTNNDTHISVYVRNNSSSDGMSIGVVNAGASVYHHLSIRHSAGYLTDAYDASTRLINTNSDSRGLFVLNRETSTSLKQFKNGSQVGSTGTGSNTADISTVSVAHYIGARNNNGSADSFVPYEFAFASIGDGLTDTENADLFTAVDAFQTALSRDV